MLYDPYIIRLPGVFDVEAHLPYEKQLDEEFHPDPKFSSKFMPYTIDIEIVTDERIDTVYGPCDCFN